MHSEGWCSSQETHTDESVELSPIYKFPIVFNTLATGSTFGIFRDLTFLLNTEQARARLLGSRAAAGFPV